MVFSTEDCARATARFASDRDPPRARGAGGASRNPARGARAPDEIRYPVSPTWRSRDAARPDRVSGPRPPRRGVGSPADLRRPPPLQRRGDGDLPRFGGAEALPRQWRHRDPCEQPTERRDPSVAERGPRRSARRPARRPASSRSCVRTALTPTSGRGSTIPEIYALIETELGRDPGYRDIGAFHVYGSDAGGIGVRRVVALRAMKADGSFNRITAGYVKRFPPRSP